jgi:hypothetical protein
MEFKESPASTYEKRNVLFLFFANFLSIFIKEMDKSIIEHATTW